MKSPPTGRSEDKGSPMAAGEANSGEMPGEHFDQCRGERIEVSAGGEGGSLEFAPVAACRNRGVMGSILPKPRSPSRWCYGRVSLGLKCTLPTRSIGVPGSPDPIGIPDYRLVDPPAAASRESDRYRRTLRMDQDRSWIFVVVRPRC